MTYPVIIAAMSANRVIGDSVSNDLPWERQIDDMEFFRGMTQNHGVVMGHKTFMSLRGIPLPNRRNYVMSSVPMQNARDVHYFRNFEQIPNWMQYEGDDVFYVIGGRTLYEQFLPHVNRMFITKFNFEAEGDILFPEFDESEWNIQEVRTLENGTVYHFDRITPVSVGQWEEPDQDDDEDYYDDDDF